MKALTNIARHGKKIAFALSLTAAALAASNTASAQHMHAAPHAWHGDIAHFHEHDWGVWRGGHWNHGWHNGVYGWWWFAGGLWYPYPAPIYPYPSPWEPPVTVVAPGPAAVAPPATRYWYFCRPSNGYYPYVASCPQAWEQVPAQPATAP